MRPAVAALASCVAVVVAGMSPGVTVSALATVALVMCVGVVIGARFYDPPWGFARRRQRAERSQFMASDIREFLEDDEEDGELSLDRWLKLRAEHDDWFVR
ncbi:MAG: hypothetical protein IPO67_16255 [Deltaproteobacteria bacterium]|nr:hypothetical protein [Deltaproteobacteria bacterium]